MAAFPNITAIPIREVLERIAAVLDQIALAIRLLAGVSIATGLIVTAGALGVSRHQRLYQSVILKTLGATRGFVARVFAVEYALLGVAAGLCGQRLAAALAWASAAGRSRSPWAGSPLTAAGRRGDRHRARARRRLPRHLPAPRPKPLGVLRSE